MFTSRALALETGHLKGVVAYVDEARQALSD